MKILYGVVGEGLGHAMRSRVILDHLVANGHQIEVMASGKAHEFLTKRFADVNRISGFHMILEENRVRLGKTLWSNVISGLTGLPRNIAKYFELIAEFHPDVVISDFESWAYLFGKTHDLPILSIDNMQVIHRCEHPEEVIRANRLQFELTKAFVKSKLPGCDAYFITSFFFPPTRKPHTQLFAPILREEILAARPTTGEHLLVYQSGSNVEELHTALRQAPIPCRIYGDARAREAGNQGVVDGNLWFRAFSEATFIEDLASCRGVVAGGGFTLMGEAVHLHKPMLAVPLGGQYEQWLNATYLERQGFGMKAEDFSDNSLVARFVANVNTYQAALNAYQSQDNRSLLNAIDNFLRELPRHLRND